METSQRLFRVIVICLVLVSAGVMLAKANTPGVHTVLLTWNAPTSGPAPTGYNIYRSATSPVCPVGQSITPYATVSGTTLTFTDTNTPTGSYNYAVTSVGSGGESACTSPVLAQVPAITQGAPSNTNAIVQ